MVKKILIIEDEKQLARFVSLELEHEGYSVVVRHDGRSGLEAAMAQDWDMILLDLMLPELDGFEVARRLRNEKQTPITMMTARDSTMDKVAGLDIGADDYITKPFAIEELLARLRANFRRQDREIQKRKKTDGTTFRDLTINKKNRQVERGGEVIDLTKREYDLLTTLMKNVNDVVTREQLVQNVWGYDEGTETNVVDVYIRYLRNKLDQDGKDSYIQTVRGLGYMLRENN
ncbi:MAG: response regulator transcription factor [Lactococcus sp.]|jgi:DNA-binding response OmpR family regulator|uniref:Transcriptional regulatory protein DltR n=3 Tax=Pseudolactococcus TaxID=3436058 RepID=A0A0D6DZ32_9LACT|nr:MULTISPECIES: response regulator transcription factor [Lactococcus]MBR6894720.1 response regulator transcription factor [Lactococcus sp.]MCJ1970211.1 response regulator transcription factor [Lactococcus carnosus]MCJ1990499.1 response regulator transcription factor [Lactococcus carnosus]MCJ1996388.1 response regulator transcription factor [Lactococcus carnosus]MCJ1999959.1 response regulator transcription factor [Lactococcus carnosus]